MRSKNIHRTKMDNDLVLFFGHMGLIERCWLVTKITCIARTWLITNHSDKQHRTHPEACQSHQEYPSARLQNGQEKRRLDEEKYLGLQDFYWTFIPEKETKRKDFYWTARQPAMKQNMKQSFIVFLQTQRMVPHRTQWNEPSIMLAICYQ